MAMGDRPGVETASAPIAALDVVLGLQYMASALGRLPFRTPFRGGSSALSNLGSSVTREVVRSFMGFASSLCISEFRSFELVVDNACKVIMPPFVRSLEVAARQIELGGVPGILYMPRDRPPIGVILYLHGGGYIGTSPNMYAYFTARLCRETECAVFVADYRLAPEFPYPAGAEDASDVYAALIDLGIDPARVFVAGDSGGGGLANTLLLDRPEDVAPMRPAGLILFSPEVDLRLDEPSVTENAQRDVLPWNIPTTSYLQASDVSSPALSPLCADLSQLPPTCVVWGADEMFRDAIRRYVERLRDEEVLTKAQEYDGMFHVFPVLMPWADTSRESLRFVRRFVEETLGGASPLIPGEIKSRLADRHG
jgi:monoterpene epsilon-lactone hydrolase